ncbi:MAG: biopolymer transporter ExbD [Betaproteobacteria bacterium]|nr:biopolymer transporter ExbD [Betaproteobacteria bacterium]
MNFLRGRRRDEPEINLIPMIDVLLVILIFLMVTTTYSRFSQLQINLPQAQGEKAIDKPTQINVAIDLQGHYVINSVPVGFRGVDALSADLHRAAGQTKDPTVVINADAKVPYQSVINVMEASRLAGYVHVTFATQETKDH